MLSYKNSSRLTIELIDTQSDEDDDEEKDADVEKWAEFVEKHLTSESHPVELREALLKRPVFLTRNAHVLKQKYGGGGGGGAGVNISQLAFFRSDPTRVQAAKSLAEALKAQSEAQARKQNSKEIEAGNEAKRNSYDPNNTMCVYRRNALKKARRVNKLFLEFVLKTDKRVLN